MAVGLISEPSVVNPVLVFFYLVIKPIAYFYSVLFILCSQFLFHLNVISKKFQIQSQYTDCTHSTQTQLLGASSTRFFWTLNNRQTNSFNVLFSFGSSGSARSPFINMMNSNNLYNPSYCLSVWSFSNCKISLILSLGLNNRFGLKVKFHQFSFLLNIKRHLHCISLILHQEKFITYIYYVWKKKKKNRILISCYKIWVNDFVALFWFTLYYVNFSQKTFYQWCFTGWLIPLREKCP